MKKTINVPTPGKRLRQYVYLTKAEKLWLMGRASVNGMAISKFVTVLIQEAMEKDIRLDLDFQGGKKDV